SSLHDGDLAKWGDPASGTIVDSTYYEGWGWIYSYVWTMPIHPVSPIDTTPVQGPFCGAVGTEGCEAIAANSNRFVAWATGCTVERGYWDIAEAGNRVTYGNDTMAIGPVDINDNLNVVSLGDGGVATLTFSKPIKNGAGFDFAVFENSFDDHFLELAFVEVSSDGVRFVRFPATSLSPTTSQIGAYGPVDPTFINNLAGKYRKGYGTPFNLDDIADSVGIDLNHITHVRVVDVVGTINPQYATYDAFGHIVNDPYPTNGYNGGFDLAGVGIINQDMEGIEGMGGGLLLTVYPNPATERITVSGAEGTVLLYDMTGRLVKQQEVDGTAVIGLQGIPRGVYILKVGESTCKIVVK
ncbi:MAG: T9SS type A sorting domain-containing protein, partial [Bacteroidales bacterium]|nr:T9SS type A sorting domain-containing protein [Bacteroidales bacterium]